MDNSEKICLQWKDFKVNASSAFGDLREDRDFTDVTLACEDGQQVEAHKVILASSSPFFKDILKKNKHPHPLIYMRGLKLEDLWSIVDFLYLGKANILQENLDSFLALAEELMLKGLTGNPEKEEEQIPYKSVQVKRENPKHSKKISNPEYQVSPKPETEVAVSVELDDLDEQIKSMTTITDIQSADRKGYIATCNICGKEAASRNMPSHIEAKHISGVSHACDICGKTSRSRDSLRMHKRNNHRTMFLGQN